MPTQTFELGQLWIDIERVPGAIVLTWRGRGSEREPQRGLRPLFDSLVREAAAGEVVVEMRFGELTFFNSATIAALLQVMNTAQRSDVPLVLTYDAAKAWQARSFGTLRHVAEQLSNSKVQIRAGDPLPTSG